MSTEPKPAEDADAPNAPALNDKTTPIKKMAESKVSLDADAVPFLSLPHPHASQQGVHTRLALPDPLPCC